MPDAGTEDGPALPTQSRDELLDLARTAALREGFNLSEYGQPDIRYELLDGKWRWVVFYPGKTDKPENFFSVLIDARTRTADVLPGDES